MSKVATARPKILVAHQWKAQRGLYGADRVMLRILRELAPIAQLLVVIESEGEFADAAREIGCTIKIINMGVLRRRQMTPLGLATVSFAMFAGACQLTRLILRERVDLVFTSTVSVVASGLAAKLTRRPHVWFIQEILGGSSRALAPLVMRMSDKVVAVSRASAQSIEKQVLENAKILVVYPGVDVRRFDSQCRASARRSIEVENEVLIAHVARIHFWKGQDYFLDALRELKTRGITGFRAVIVGDIYPGYEDLRARLKQKVNDLMLSEQVRFLGHRNDADEIFTAADIVVSPATLPEPFGLVVAEAMAARRPVIAGANGGPSEMIEDGMSGFLIPTNNARVFADRLGQLIADKDLRERIGRAGRQRIETSFSAEAFDRRIRELVESLLRRRFASLTHLNCFQQSRAL